MPMSEALYSDMNKCLLTKPDDNAHSFCVNNRRRSKAKLCDSQNHSIAKGMLANKPRNVSGQVIVGVLVQTDNFEIKD